MGGFKTWCAISAGVVCLGMTTLSRAGEPEEAVYSVFEATCLGFLHDYKKLPPVLDGMGTELPAAKAKAALAPHDGRVWVVKIKDTGIMVAIADTGACSAASANANGNMVTNIFENNIKNTLLDEKRNGPKIMRVYSVKISKDHGKDNGIVMLSSPINSSNTGIIMNAIKKPRSEQ